MSDEYPECEKMKSVQPESQQIGCFLEWLGEQGIELCKFDEELWGGNYRPHAMSIERRLAEYFEVDLNKVEDERQQILDEIRENTSTTENK